ncbi:hypothetical protein Tco_0600939 [Tanacetum coccineum]
MEVSVGSENAQVGGDMRTYTLAHGHNSRARGRRLRVEVVVCLVGVIMTRVTQDAVNTWVVICSIDVTARIGGLQYVTDVSGEECCGNFSYNRSDTLLRSLSTLEGEIDTGNIRKQVYSDIDTQTDVEIQEMECETDTSYYGDDNNGAARTLIHYIGESTHTECMEWVLVLVIGCGLSLETQECEEGTSVSCLHTGCKTRDETWEGGVQQGVDSVSIQETIDTQSVEILNELDGGGLVLIDEGDSGDTVGGEEFDRPRRGVIYCDGSGALLCADS